MPQQQTFSQQGRYRGASCLEGRSSLRASPAPVVGTTRAGEALDVALECSNERKLAKFHSQGPPAAAGPAPSSRLSPSQSARHEIARRN